MKAVVRTKSGKGSPYLAEMPVPCATPGQVVIRVLASPVNPSDDYFSRGLMGEVTTEPYICGFEGAGVITEVGAGVPHELIGKNVAVWPVFSGDAKGHTNLWAQYTRVPFDACLVLNEAINPEEYCGLFVNPLTALSFVRIVKDMKQKAMVHTAAMSSLGRALLKICKAEGIAVIGVVRKLEDVKTLYDLGVKAALDLNSPKFVEELREACNKFGARVAFDAVAGDMTPMLIKAMPESSLIYVYGCLSDKMPDLTSMKDMMAKKHITTEEFGVMSHKLMTDPEERKKAMEFIREDAATGGKLFKLAVAKRFRLDEFKEALDTYRRVAALGKVVLLPNAC